MPQRLQRGRRPGFRLPDGAVYVGRPTVYGNPHRVEGLAPRGVPVTDVHRAEAVRLYDLDLRAGRLPVNHEDVRRELRGKDLVCWCPLDQPCHADLLLAVANADPPKETQ